MNLKQIRLQPELEKAIADLGFTEFTEIQEKTIPLIQQGQDIIGQAYTGSGKTAAYGVPALEKVIRGQGIQVLILVPTRELCNQVTTEMHKFSKYKHVRIAEIYGGVSINPQIDALKQADVIICTPGRLLDHLGRRTINISRIKILVLDEADKMFEMGFIDDVKEIIKHTPREKQTLLFSATMPQEVLDISHHYMRHPTKIKLQTHVDKSKLVQHYYEIGAHDKFSLLDHLLKEQAEGLVIIFCATRNRVDDVRNNLQKQGFVAQALHGGLSQNKRKQVMDAFHARKLDILIASDVAARGLDIKDVGLIINYDLPKTPLDYVHRIGRTARAGSTGKVISLLAPVDHDNFRRILADRSNTIHEMAVPQFARVQFLSNSRRREGNSRFSQRTQQGRRQFGSRRRY